MVEHIVGAAGIDVGGVEYTTDARDGRDNRVNAPGKRYGIRSGFSYVLLLMSEPNNDFFAWATDPSRTSDELFTVEVLLEGLRGHPKWPFPNQRLDLDERMAMMEQRRLNPAYRPSLPQDELEHLQQRPAVVIRFGHSGMSDRCTRDLEALRFFPALEDVNLASTNASDPQL